MTMTGDTATSRAERIDELVAAHQRQGDLTAGQLAEARAILLESQRDLENARQNIADLHEHWRGRIDEAMMGLPERVAEAQRPAFQAQIADDLWGLVDTLG